MATSDKPASTDPSLGMKVVMSTIRGKFRSVQHVSTGTLAEWMKRTKGSNSTETPPDSCTQRRAIVLLDTRPEEEFAVSHLPGAVRVDPNTSDIETLADTVPELKSTGEGRQLEPLTIVCYCSLGYRSSTMVQRIQNYLTHNAGAPEDGRIEVYNLEGSLFKWANEGRHMVDYQNRETVYAHPYSSVFGKLLLKHLRRETPE